MTNRFKGAHHKIVASTTGRCVVCGARLLKDGRGYCHDPADYQQETHEGYTKRYDTCVTCGGAGIVDRPDGWQIGCSTCGGRGRIEVGYDRALADALTENTDAR